MNFFFLPRQKMICLLMDGGSEAPSQGSRLNGGASPFQHSLTLRIWSFPFFVFHLSDLQFVSFFFPLPSLLLRSAFVPVHHVHRVSFFLTASSDPRYSSSSPEDSLIPRFPSRSTHRKKERRAQIYRTRSQESGFAASCRRLLSYDNTLCSQMLHECIWPHLIGRGLVQYKCACSLGAVSSQHTNDSLFGIQGQTLHMNKSLVQHLVGTKRFS